MSPGEVRARLHRGDVAGAWDLVGGRLAAAPDNADWLYLGAVCQRYLGRPADALAMLARLTSLTPEMARAQQELGHCYRALDDAPSARAAYRRAVTLNPALRASWQALSELLAAGSPAAREAEAQARHLAGLPAELLTVTSLLHEGRLYRAERLCRAYLRQQPRHVEAMRLLALIGMRLQIVDDAEFLLESALTFEPDYVPARIDYVNVLQKRQKHARALAEAERLSEAHPDVGQFRVVLANACAAAGQYRRALELYDRELAEQGENASLHMARGHALKTVGRTTEAVSAYHRAARVHPGFGDAYWSLANLKTYEFADADIAEMAAFEDSSELTADDRAGLAFALGRAFELRGDYAASFAHYAHGNACRREQSRYRPERLTREVERHKRVCTAHFFDERAGWGCLDDAPIFIVGLPRAGSTLLEQILASHSQVDGTLELPNILAQVHRLEGRRRSGDEPKYPDVLRRLAAEQVRQFGDRYVQDTRVHRQGAPRFTDKMPNNFRHVGLIHLMLPKARIIDARRDAMDCCVSAFKQQFAEGQEFSYGLDWLGQYYRDYVELMAHWDAVLPGRVLRVQHEAVLQDLEGEVRRLLDFCGLPFEPACLEFHETERAVRTASSEQVRQPLYQSSRQHWRVYEPWLDPLKSALGSLYVRPAVQE